MQHVCWQLSRVKGLRENNIEFSPRYCWLPHLLVVFLLFLQGKEH